LYIFLSIIAIQVYFPFYWVFFKVGKKGREGGRKEKKKGRKEGKILSSISIRISNSFSPNWDLGQIQTSNIILILYGDPIQVLLLSDRPRSI
jgi:hypothetical protein